MGLITEQDGLADGYETVTVPALPLGSTYPGA
jgi:hypothetical protein